MTLEEFKKNFTQYLSSVSDEDLQAALERAGCVFLDPSEQPLQVGPVLTESIESCAAPFHELALAA
jgi:hypothetical protein